MKKLWTAFWLFSALALLSASDAGAEKMLLRQWAGNVTMNIPFVSSKVDIDGKLSDAEWAKAAEIAGFSLLKGNYVSCGSGALKLMRDNDNLYLAIRMSAVNNEPSGGLRAAVNDRDGQVYSDDSVDILLISDQDPKLMYQFIINSLGTVWDARRDLSLNDAVDLKWNLENIRVKAQVVNGFWDIEAALPLAGIGNPQKYLKINVGRNWKEAGPALLNSASKYFTVDRMVTVRWDKNRGTMRQPDFGAIGNGEWNIALSADNPTNRELCLAAMLRHYTFSADKKQKIMHKDVVKSVQIAPGKSASLAAEFTAPGVEKYYFTSVLYDPKSKLVHASRSFTGERGSTERHPASVVFALPGLGTGECRYYPGYDRGTLHFRTGNGKVNSAVLILPDGKEITGKFERGSFVFRFPVPAAAGKYRFGMKFPDFKGKNFYPNAFSLKKRTFPWLGAGIGSDKIVLPPFEPLKADGAKVKLLLSCVKLNSSGIWDEFEAENKTMLASPMYFEAQLNGKVERFDAGELSAPAVEAQGYALNYTFASRSASGIELGGTSRWEYDGFQWLKMQLSGKVKQIDRLTLCIPLKDSEAPLFHVVSNFIRKNPAGRIPVGSGIVWDGTKLPRVNAQGVETLHPQGVPYIWLGGPSRGLSCFTESNSGYALDRKKSAVRLIRKDGVMTLEWDFINIPTVLGKNARKFEFGLMPTPVKRVDPQLNQYTHDAYGVGARGMKNFTFVARQLMGFTYWPHEPYNQDFTLFRAACRAVRNGGKDNMKADLDHWMKSYGKQVFDEMSRVPSAGNIPTHYDNVRVSYWRAQMDKPERRPGVPYKYSDPKLMWMFEDIPEYFRAEWYNPSPQNYYGARRVSLTPSEIDYMIYCLAQELDNGCHGIYLDDMFLMPDPNGETIAVKDSEGKFHPANGILGMRELVKRIAVLQHQRNLYPRLIQIHMTNALLIPCFSLATSTLGWEDHYGEKPHPERFSVDQILATDSGTQLGVECCILAGIFRQTTSKNEWGKKLRKLTRSMIALSLPFNAKYKSPINTGADAKFYYRIISLASDFGFWKKECRFVPFWHQDAAALQVGDGKVLASSWRFPGRVLLILGNTDKKEKTLNLSVDVKALQLPDNFKLINAENGKPENPASIVLDGYDFKLLILE